MVTLARSVSPVSSVTMKVNAAVPENPGAGSKENLPVEGSTSVRCPWTGSSA